MHTVRKRSPITVSALALALATSACGSGDEAGAATTTLTFAQPTPESLTYFPYIVADELGWFKEEGIKVELAPSSEMVPTTTLVTNGSADIGAGSGSEVLYAAQQGTELKVVHDYFTSAIEGIVVPKDSDIADMAGLRGQTIGMASDEERALIAAALEEVGMGSNDVETVVVGTSGPTLVNALQSGSIDAFAGSVIDFAAIGAAGIETRNITPPEVASSPQGAIFVSPQTLQKRPEVVKSFLRAFVRATELASTNPERVRKIVRERVPEEWQNEEFANALLEKTIEATRPGDDGYGLLPRATWAALEKRMVGTGELKQPIGLGDVLVKNLAPR